MPGSGTFSITPNNPWDFFARGAGGKIDRLQAAAWAAAVAGDQVPQTLDYQRQPVGADRLSEKSIGARAENVDPAVPEVAHQKVSAKHPKDAGAISTPQGVQGAL